MAADPHAPGSRAAVGDEVRVPYRRGGVRLAEVVEVEHNPDNGKVYLLVDPGVGLLEWWPAEKVIADA